MKKGYRVENGGRVGEEKEEEEDREIEEECNKWKKESGGSKGE